MNPRRRHHHTTEPDDNAFVIGTLYRYRDSHQLCNFERLSSRKADSSYDEEYRLIQDPDHNKLFLLLGYEKNMFSIEPEIRFKFLFEDQVLYTYFSKERFLDFFEKVK